MLVTPPAGEVTADMEDFNTSDGSVLGSVTLSLTGGVELEISPDVEVY